MSARGVRRVLQAEEVRQLLHYNPDTGNLTWLPRHESHFMSVGSCKRWNARYAGQLAGSIESNGYIDVAIFNVLYKAHRIAWLIHHGEWPDVVDHVNRIKSDNRLVNLRSVTQSVNMQNATMRSDNTSGHVGVAWYKSTNKWRARIKIEGRDVHLGLFDTFWEAAHARNVVSQHHNFHPDHGVTL